MTDPIKAEPVAWKYEYAGGTIACTAIRYEPAVLRALGYTETPLYTHAQLVEERRRAWNEAIEAAAAVVLRWVDPIMATDHENSTYRSAATAIRDLTKDSTHD